MRSKQELRKGRLVATVLAGSWRCASIPPLNFNETELDEVTPLLFGAGAAALGWRRVDNAELRTTASAEILHQAYRLQALQAEISKHKVAKVFRLLREAGAEAILAKGWLAASIYSDPALRPAGDMDLCIRAEHFKLAEAAVRVHEATDCLIDLHRRFYEFKDRTVDDLFARSKIVYLEEEEIRTLCPEDHLALLCIHFLKHGAWRPLWLCDIAALIESLPANFDWNLCLGRDQTRAGWIACAIGLAKRLLGAETQNVPVEASASELPDWVVDNVFRQWGNPFANNQAPMKHPVPMADLLRHPGGLIARLRERWPNAILATVSVEGSFNNFPRLPYQMANCVVRMGRLLGERSEDLRQN